MEKDEKLEEKLKEATLKRRALNLHESFSGKIATEIKIPIHSLEDLALAYSPGVAEPCRKIAENPADAFRYTNRGNTVAVVSSGTAVLGLGNIGPEAALPVMEGKALLFKYFADLDSVPICVKAQSAEQIIELCCALEPSFGGINLEDIASPDCVTIERELQKRLSIPVFHDDQHGTAIVSAAALINAAKLTGRSLQDMTVVISGTGAAGSAIGRTLKQLGVKTLYGYNSRGPLSKNTPRLNFVEREMLDEGVFSDPKEKRDLADLLRGAEAFIGVSIGGLVTGEMVSQMSKNPIILAMANPIPEIFPEAALAAGAAIVGTGRMDYPNQINNVLAFPGIFRGALKAQRERADQRLHEAVNESATHGAKIVSGIGVSIDDEVKMAAVQALAAVLGPEELGPNSILPSPMDPRVVRQISAVVYEICRKR